MYALVEPEMIRQFIDYTVQPVQVISPREGVYKYYTRSQFVNQGYYDLNSHTDGWERKRG
jgi:hypothetical protein